MENMRIMVQLLLVPALLTFLAGTLLYFLAKTPIQEIESFLLIIISAILFVGSTITITLIEIEKRRTY